MIINRTTSLLAITQDLVESKGLVVFMYPRANTGDDKLHENAMRHVIARSITHNNSDYSLSVFFCIRGMHQAGLRLP